MGQRREEFYPDLIPISGRSPGEGNSNLRHYSWLENSMDLVGYRPWGHKELDMTEQLILL